MFVSISIVTRYAKSLETGAVSIEIFMLCWNLSSGPKHRGWLQKGISCLQMIFVLIWMKQTLICFILQRDGTGNGLSNIKDTFAESMQLQISVLHLSMSIFQSSRLVSHVQKMTGQNVKKNCLMCQIPIKMLKQHATPNSSLHIIKIYSSKGCRKSSQIWTICMYSVLLANTAILNIQIFSSRYHFRLCVFASTYEYFYYWHWRVLPNVLQSKWCQRTFLKTLYLCYLRLLTQIIIYCRLAHLTGAFRIILI